ncbi:protein yippee-like 5 [Hippopotamus amphibius kiboko]|uniref:protein yippee-like 5 n=1 Tax=Hippopotamus amphibius kiboko TaxID=575201 RepID=UPI002593CB83|nr:protein yippee-like 5 [Hippopotamus amphibius kiboko]
MVKSERTGNHQWLLFRVLLLSIYRLPEWRACFRRDQRLRGGRNAQGLFGEKWAGVVGIERTLVAEELNLNWGAKSRWRPRISQPLGVFRTSTIKIGRIFLDHIGGTRLFSCANCDTIRSELISARITAATDRAFLFNKVVNLQCSEVQDRDMLTGRHVVRDVSCRNCNSKLGWIHEFATEDSQRYKEGRVILERALVRESEGFEEHVPSDNSRRKKDKSIFSLRTKICLPTLSP